MEHSEHSKDMMRQKSSIIERIITPKEIRLIRSRNHQLNQLLQSDQTEYERQLLSWEKEIAHGLSQTRSDVVTTSVVIPAYNEQAEILQPLAALSRQDYKDGLEVIVVVNNSTDRTAEIARACGAKVIEYSLSDEERKTLAPIAVARQRGLEASRGKYIISTDADTIFKSTWVRSLTQLLKNPRISLATGRLYALDTNLDLELSARAFALSRRFKMLSIGHTHPGGIAPGANSAFRKEDALKAGGYDLYAYPGEDTRMFEELNKFGKPALPFSNEEAVWTSPRRLGATSIKELAKEHIRTILKKERGKLLTEQYGTKNEPINFRRK